MRIVRSPPADLERAAPDGPANDEALRRNVETHRAAVCREHERAEARLLPRLARGTLSADVWVPTEAAPVRRNIFELVRDHYRLLVVGERWSGKSALALVLTGQAARRDLGFGECVPLFVPVSRLEQSRLDEGEIDRLNPAIGGGGARFALEEGRALVVIDGGDGAAQLDALKESIATLAAMYAQSRFIVMTRPLPPKVAGVSSTALDGFVTVRLAMPEGPPPGQIYELDERRSPALRVQHIIEEVDRLLDRWSLASLPRGAALARFTRRGRLLLASALAMSLHETRTIDLTEEALAARLADGLHGARWFADTEQLLHDDEHAHGGEAVEDAPRMGRQMLDEIRAYPGLIVETRAGVFAFADLAYQQYLAAAFFLLRGDAEHWFVMQRCVQLREDPWWHEVIVFTAGLNPPLSSTLPARKLIRALLEASVASDSVITFLAARCAQVASFVPDTLQAQIDRRLRAAVPPRSATQVMHLIDDVGEIAAPALIGALPTATANERACIAMALGRIDYPPALRALARLVGDEERITEPIFAWAWTVDAVMKDVPVGFFAFAAFFSLAHSNAAAGRMFDEVLSRASRATLVAFVDLVAPTILLGPWWGERDEAERDPDRLAARFEKVRRALGRRGGIRR